MMLNKALARWGRHSQRKVSIDERPGCAYGLVTRRGLDDLSQDFERLELKINGLIGGVVLTFFLELWKAWH
ncbi:MAG: hypothetical protein M1136_00910 [Chloroflexi bacterium]|nr:hypothetical protein [Chloroflexota bacterium]